MSRARRARSAVRRHGAAQPGHPLIRATALVTAAALGFVTVGYEAYATRIEHEFDSVDNSSLIREVETTASADPEDTSAGQDVNILLMGSDVRDGENGAIGGREAGGMRNDTTVLLHISADRTRVEAVSIPRDLQVQVSDCTLFDGTEVNGWYGDFNNAFGNGGKQGDAAEAAACAINTVQDMTGIGIDHWAVVDFVGFEDMIDSIGGVPMCIPQDISSTTARLEITAGPHVLDGATALAYARLRTAETGGVSGSDLQRITRQQELLQQVARTLLGKNLLTDIDQLTQFVKAMAASLTMDTQLGDLQYLQGLAWSLRGLRTDDITFATVPWEYTEDFLNVLATEDAEAMWEQLRHDEPLTIDAEGDASSEWDSGRVEADSPTSSGSPTTNDASQQGTEGSAQDSAETVDDLLAECSI
ncbi:LCP family protein [Demequina zhanjiangensis]|uniref:LCP family protein n=1 Tax=Demequina zhanjiangensis TaxID=3051659 RepID=A0ABT8FXN1_9MICO|nr:LCP family protein [Demequina sp. SYSU T00b26]MDN4471670.1 LCP family protein [Demequina sp. SYSU T00b26]